MKKQKTIREIGIVGLFILAFIGWIEKKVYRKKFTYRDQVIRARRLVSEDRVWFSHVYGIEQVCIRHERLLGEDWAEESHVNISTFRDKLTLHAMQLSRQKSPTHESNLTRH